MSNLGTKGTVITSLIWKFAERIGAQGVNLIVSIVLARILAPEDYGIVALVTIFITISNVFIEVGLPTALVQKKDADELDFSTVFYCNIIISIILYVIIFLASPLIAQFYNNGNLTNVLRVLGITILIAGLKSVQNAYVSKNMLFKKFFISTSIGTIGSAIIGIYMAYRGAGVWALVIQQLTNTFVDTLVLWFTVKWRPKLKFSLNRLKELFKFGWKMLGAGLIEVVYNEAYGIIIGKVYNAEQLAYYNKSNQFPKLITENANGSIAAVILPALSKEQEDREKVKNMMRKAIKISSFVLFPMLFGLAAVSETLVKILLTDKWLPIVPFMQVTCFTYALWPIHTVNLQAISAIGRSDIYLKLEVIKKIVGIVILFISIPFGIFIMVISRAIYSFIVSFINAFPNNKLFKYSVWNQFKDIMPSFILSIIMVVIIYPIKFLQLNNLSILAIQIVIGIIVYILFAIIFKMETFSYLLETIKNVIKKGEKNGN